MEILRKRRENCRSEAKPRSTTRRMRKIPLKTQVSNKALCTTVRSSIFTNSHLSTSAIILYENPLKHSFDRTGVHKNYMLESLIYSHSVDFIFFPIHFFIRFKLDYS